MKKVTKNKINMSNLILKDENKKKNKRKTHLNWVNSQTL
jgi:hypothetical protein